MPEPQKQVDETMQGARDGERRRLALAQGLESTWTRDFNGKSKTLGGK